MNNSTVKNLEMGFFCQHKMAEVKLTLDVSVESVRDPEKNSVECRKILRKKCDHQEESCKGCMEMQKINAKLEFYDV